MALSGSLNFQVDGVGSYSLFFEEFIAKLETFTGEFLETIEAEAREVATLAGERVLGNLHLIDVAFLYAELVKPPMKGARAKDSRVVATGFAEELVGVFVPDNDGGASEDSTNVEGLTG